jgi:hypothetical protein
MEYLYQALAWWPLLVIAIALIVFLYLAIRYWPVVQLYRYERHQPWFNEIMDVSRMVERKFDRQIGHCFYWEDLERKRTVVLQWPPKQHPVLIYRWMTENDIQEMMRYSEDPNEENMFIPELYAGRSLPIRASYAMRNTLRNLMYRLQPYQYVH